MFKLDQVGVDLDRGEDLIVQSAQPREAAQDHVGVRKGKAGRGSLEVLHFHFNVLCGGKGRGEAKLIFKGENLLFMSMLQSVQKNC